MSWLFTHNGMQWGCMNRATLEKPDCAYVESLADLLPCLVGTSYSTSMDRSREVLIFSLQDLGSFIPDVRQVLTPGCCTDLQPGRGALGAFIWDAAVRAMAPAAEVRP